MDDYGKLLNISILAALKAGLEIMDIGRSNDYNIDAKADESPVTTADIRADKVITSLLEDTGLPVLSEEGRSVSYRKRKSWKRFWLVDPLDGTREFIDGTGEFTVNIALIADQQPWSGVVYVPVRDILYAGIKNFGSWRFNNASALNNLAYGSFGDAVNNILTGKQGPGTDNRFWVNVPSDINWLENGIQLPFTSKKGYGIVASRSFPDERTHRFINEFSKRYHDTRIVTTGSSIKLCMLAEGEADIYPRFTNIWEWDTAAGHAIVLAAGGGVVQAANTGQQLIYNKKDNLNPWFVGFRNRELLENIKDMIPFPLKKGSPGN